MACSCGSGAGASGAKWENVKADGTVSRAGTKSEALASQTANGGYIRQAS